MKTTILVAVLAVLAVMVGIASAETFNAAPGSIKATFDGPCVTITVTGVGDIASVEQYRNTKTSAGNCTVSRESKVNDYVTRYAFVNGKATFDGSEGIGCQLVNTAGQFLNVPDVCENKFRKVEMVGIGCSCVNGECNLVLKP